ncbi:DUF3492 domain-containing protein [Streptomyces sp. URMC 123]|uniref:DUF3492 domain-containing protein n=1 Tax=Streptomyces sp. URMC 123 TaxID=3423403 RepID=UPI003F1A1188
MRVGLLTEGGYPYTTGEARLWCDRLVRGLADHEFEVYALSRSERQEMAGWVPLPRHVQRVRTAPLWGPPEEIRSTRAGGAWGRRERRRFLEHFGDLVGALCAAAPGAPAGPAAPALDRPPADGPAAVRSSAAEADRFAAGLYGLAELAREHGGLAGALLSETAVRVLEAACRAPGALRGAHGARLPDLLVIAEHLERSLRPLSLDWYGDGDQGLGGVELCHAASGGAAALPGLLAKRFFGVPLLVTEYGVRLREHYLSWAGAPYSLPVRALLAAFQRRLAAEIYAEAALITPGNTHARRWQERCGADRARLRTVYPGMDAERFTALGGAAASVSSAASVGSGASDGTGGSVGSGDAAAAGGASEAVTGSAPAEGAVDGGEGADAGALVSGDRTDGRTDGRDDLDGSAASGRREGACGRGDHTLVWVGRIEPAKDLIALLHAFVEIRRAEPGARLRIIGTEGRGAEAPAYAEHCRALAARLFADDSAPEGAAALCPVTFEDLGCPDVPEAADAYADASVVLLSSVVEGFPVNLVEAMFCARATVSTDVGAVCEVIGGTGLVVPPRNPKALADAAVALLRDPERRARLGEAARARALELFTVEQNIAAFRGIYGELRALAPARPEAPGADGEETRPFARPPESQVPVAAPAPCRWSAVLPSWVTPAARAARPAVAVGPRAHRGEA